ncbi:hypothetical protein D3C71_2188640 [compost metagenome]
MIETVPWQLNRFIVAIELDAFRKRANLTNAGVIRAQVAQRHFQRAAIDLRYGEAQLVILSAGQRPA